MRNRFAVEITHEDDHPNDPPATVFPVSAEHTGTVVTAAIREGATHIQIFVTEE